MEKYSLSNCQAQLIKGEVKELKYNKNIVYAGIPAISTKTKLEDPQYVNCKLPVLRLTA